MQETKQPSDTWHSYYQRQTSPSDTADVRNSLPLCFGSTHNPSSVHLWQKWQGAAAQQQQRTARTWHSLCYHVGHSLPVLGLGTRVPPHGFGGDDGSGGEHGGGVGGVGPQAHLLGEDEVPQGDAGRQDATPLAGEEGLNL